MSATKQGTSAAALETPTPYAPQPTKLRHVRGDPLHYCGAAWA
ncbi:hypothetical protein [Actinopolymorpha pittospori]|uniref:Uncharacterized protein n=1 Tax=Actinopolymorpha pittospori TaxID=648752 RepID=A0A927N0C5_9ACTN|nr:hypothetical protein [Actinopolymorpha pittospori]MBE1609926.1 hypothetical protein [Actinopolymorpha pittospori]